MRLNWWMVVTAGLVSLGTTPLAAQPGGGMRDMRHDSATMAQMAVIHELMMNHQQISRSVTNLPDGIRTVTESDDSLLARRIREHAVTMNERVTAGDDPGLPMESPALRAIFLNGDNVHTVVTPTGKGVVVEQTSSDSATVSALQRHAAEVSDLVREGMAAMHAAMMKRMMGGHQMPF